MLGGGEVEEGVRMCGAICLHRIPSLEDHPGSAVHDCLFNASVGTNSSRETWGAA
jgi:hypothetical protein